MSIDWTAEKPSLLPGRSWWLGLVLILVLAGVLRLPGYNFSIPYLDHPDEPAFYLTALEWRGQFDTQGYLSGYPPLYIWLQALAQIALGPLGMDSVAEAVALFRLLSVVFSLLSLMLIALTAHRIMGRWAGWAAGIAWAVAPLIVENAIYATPDPLLYLLVALALWLAVEALYERPAWAVWSVAVGCLAILDKYYVLTAVLPGAGAALIVARRQRRLGLKLLGLQTLLLAVTAAISIVGVFTLPREAAAARESGLASVLNPGRVLNNLTYAVAPLAPIAAAVYALAGAAAWLAAPRLNARRAYLAPILLILLVVITIPWLAATFSMVNATTRLKDVLPATVGVCILLGVAVGQIAALAPGRWRWSVGLLTVLPLLVLVWLPQTAASWFIVQDRLLPDTRVALRQWADAAVEPGTVLVGLENEKTFNPYWGGISANHWFDWWVTNDPLSKTVDEWRQDFGISYAAIDLSHLEREAESEAFRAFMETVLPLRTFSGPTRGPEMTFVRLWRPEVESGATFGDLIQLVGYDLSATEAAPGETLALRFYWSAGAPPDTNYSLFVHLVPADGDGIPVAQVDGAPASIGRPTILWTDASETLISDSFMLALPNDLPPGDYDLRIGLYDLDTSVRLLVNDGSGETGDSLRLSPFTVIAPPA